MRRASSICVMTRAVCRLNHDDDLARMRAESFMAVALENLRESGESAANDAIRAPVSLNASRE